MKRGAQLGTSDTSSIFATSPLEERGLIMRRKEELDWYVNITPEGFDLALEWIYENIS